MKAIIFFLSLLGTAFAQEDCRTRIQFMGKNISEQSFTVKIVNKTSVNMIYYVRFNTPSQNATIHTTPVVASGDSINYKLFGTNDCNGIQVKSTYDNNQCNNDWISTALSCNVLPVKFGKIYPPRQVKDSVEIRFTVQEARDVKHFTIMITRDKGRTFKPLVLITDKLTPNKEYTFKFKL